jgi:peptide/nickel transport system substrate-binding protein
MWASPLPRHLLGEQYATDKQGLNSSSYWGTNYVGTGPFAVRTLLPGTEIQLTANDRYVLGRPKIDRIVIHFIPDMNTLITNFAAGTVDLVLGRGLTPQLATQLKGQRPDVKFRQELSGSLVAFPQFMNPNPPIIAQTPFRQALMYGLDRQQLVDSLTDGIGSVADSYIGPDWAQQAAVANSIVKYSYDRNRADQMLQGLGYTRGGDGMYRESSGQPLAIEVRSHGSPIGEQTTTAVAALWTRAGVAATPVIVNEAQMNDRQYLAIFPGISVAMAQTPPNAVLRWRSSLAPVEENHYSGTNYSRYQDPAFDALITRFSTAIAPEDQDAALRQIVQELTANLLIMPLFYNPSITAMSNAMQNVGAAQGVWDVHLWDVASPRA